MDGRPFDTSTLASRLSGQIAVAGDAEYDEARAVWNGRFDRRPAIVVRCRGASDVQEAVRFAREHALPVSVKGGGHAYAGNTVGDDGLLIDLSPMRAVEVDPEARVARVAGGATWADVDAATQAHQLATPGGTVSSVGVAGFVLGGGLGWLTRKYGTASDNLLGATVVTAEGSTVHASESENADLLWGLRGGGGNFGVVTEFELRLHDFGPDVYAGQIFYPLEGSAERLRFFRDYMRDAPEDLMAFAFFLRVPPIEAFPADYHGNLVLDLVLTWTGPVEDGEQAVAPFRSLGEPFLEFVGTQPYLTLQQSFDAGMSPKGNRWYTRYHYFDTLSDVAIDDLIAGLEPFPGEFTTVYFGAEGGAAGSVGPDATAFPHRNDEMSLHVFPGWVSPSDDEAITRWCRGLGDTMGAHANGGVYVNMLGEDEKDRLADAYGANFSRLRALKAKWDPENFFRMNHNAEPDL